MSRHEFLKQGFLKITEAFSAEKMQQLTQTVNRLIESNHQDILLENGQAKKLLYMFDKNPVFLELLVSKPMLALLKKYVRDYQAVVPSWEDMIIKMPFANNGFKPHQDLPLQSINSDVFTTAIYLHDSHHNPVHFLPGSHKLGPLTKDELTALTKTEKNNFIAMPAKCGDIMMHYAKTIHFSQDNQSNQPRYTWYIEFRTLDQLKNDSPWDDDWIMKRRAIFVSALQQYQPAYLKEFAPDFTALQPYLDNLQLRVPHVTETVDFDMNSPYYHF